MAELFMTRKEDGTPNDNYFSQKLGIHSLRRHFVEMERELLNVGGTLRVPKSSGTRSVPDTLRGGTRSVPDTLRGGTRSVPDTLRNGTRSVPDTISETNVAEAEKMLSADRVFKELVVQRSRAYVKKSRGDVNRRFAPYYNGASSAELSEEGEEKICVLISTDIRGKIEKHIKNTFLKAMQAPIGVRPVLKAWMELN